LKDPFGEPRQSPSKSNPSSEWEDGSMNDFDEASLELAIIERLGLFETKHFNIAQK